MFLHLQQNYCYTLLNIYSVGKPTLRRKKMIVGIEGTVERKDPTFVHLNVNGIIYEVNVSINTSNSIQDTKVKLFVTQVIREDADLLFGFMDTNEKKMFDTVLKINGVGPKVGLAICSTFTPSTFAKVVASKDVGMLKRVPAFSKIIRTMPSMFLPNTGFRAATWSSVSSNKGFISNKRISAKLSNISVMIPSTKPK